MEPFASARITPAWTLICLEDRRLSSLGLSHNWIVLRRRSTAAAWGCAHPAAQVDAPFAFTFPIVYYWRRATEPHGSAAAHRDNQTQA